MSSIDDLLAAALKGLGPKPDDSASQPVKRDYSQRMSEAVALAVAQELRDRGCGGTRPAPPGEVGISGAERRLAGGIGAKKVDVSWATEESGLLLAISVKTINFRDGRSKNFQKNLTNRRGDMLIEAVTLHRRYPYAVVAGLIFLDHEARNDDTERRRSTFHNAEPRLRLFTGRHDPGGRDEQFEKLWLTLVDANPFTPQWDSYEVNNLEGEVDLDTELTALLELVAERNFDFYEMDGTNIKRTG